MVSSWSRGVTCTIIRFWKCLQGEGNGVIKAAYQMLNLVLEKVAQNAHHRVPRSALQGQRCQARKWLQLQSRPLGVPLSGSLFSTLRSVQRGRQLRVHVQAPAGN